MKNFLLFPIIFLAPLFAFAQSNKIRAELKKAAKYEEQKKFDTYHVYEKYLTDQQRFELNMYYWELYVDIPHENPNNYWLLNAAKKNNVCAQINVAYSYLVGRTVKKDSKQAKYWLQRAINNNSITANYYYALHILMDTKKDEDSLLWYLEKATTFNDANVALGFIYQYGIHTQKNQTLADEYFVKYKNNLPIRQREIFEKEYSIENSIFCPNGFCSKELVAAQTETIISTLQKDTLANVFIKTNGAYNYLMQQQSWDKAICIKKILVELGIKPQRILFEYGYIGNSSIVEITTQIRNDATTNNDAPPPHPYMFNKYFILQCK